MGANKRQKVTHLVGAPLDEHLRWEEQNLTEDFLPALRRFCDLNAREGNRTARAFQESGRPEFVEFPEPRWREINAQPEAVLAASLSPVTPESSGSGATPGDEHTRGNVASISASFLGRDKSMYSDSIGGTPTALDDDFLEKSYAAHETLQSSQIIDDSTILSDSSSFGSTISDFGEAPATTKAAPAQSNNFSTLRTLKSLPPADRLDKTKTLTVNLLVGLISIEPLKTVTVQRGTPQERDMEIIELIVGDDTRVPFRITFWLTPLPPSTSRVPINTKTAQLLGKARNDQPLRDALKADNMRPGAILQFFHVALTSYNGVVCGQSLSSRISRSRTSVMALPPNALSVTKPNDSQRKRLENVMEWVKRFVPDATLYKYKGIALEGPAGKREDEERRMGKALRGDYHLPPDTQ